MSRSTPRWVWYGGRPSLDLVNTRRDRGGDAVEYLREPADLAGWLAAAGLATDACLATDGGLAADGRAADGGLPSDRGLADADLAGAAALAEARDLREVIDAGVVAVVDGRPFPPRVRDDLNRWLEAGPARPPRLAIAGGVPVLGDPDEPRSLRQVLAEIALDAAMLLGTAQRDRLRICPGPGCGGRFADDSPAGRRRWCSMAVCGNRAKAAAHRRAAQHRTAAQGSAGQGSAAGGLAKG